MAAEADTETKPNDAPVDEPKKEVEEKPKEEETKKEAKEEKKKAPPKEPAPPKPTVHKTDFEKDIVYLYQFTRTPLLPSLSAFCLKTETWLRANEIKYENVDHKMKYRSKQGLLPFIELNGEEINDSSNIIRELGKRHDKDLDKDLTPEQRALSHTTISMIENHLFWVVFWWRSKYPSKFMKGTQFNLQAALGSKLPKPLLEFVFKMRFRQGQKRVRAQGLGVHSAEEIEEFGKDDLKVLSNLLGDKDFFFGRATPTLLDLAAFSVVAQFVYYDGTDWPMHSWVEENAPNLKAHVERIKDKYYPDWKEMCETLDLNTHLPKPPPKEEPAKEEAKKDEGEKKEDAPAAEDKKEEEKKE